MPAPGVVAVFLADTILVSLTALCVWTAVTDLITVRFRASAPDPLTMPEAEWRGAHRSNRQRIHGRA